MKITLLVAGATLALSHAATAAAQTSSSNAPAPPAYFEFQVERPAAVRPDSPLPVYPPTLKAAGTTGNVLVQFVVDVDGVPDVHTFTVLKSDHALFSQAVRDALPRMRFVPARIEGRTVRQVVQMPFVFGAPATDH